MHNPIILLAIESSCDDTSAAVCIDGVIASNVVYSQKIHEEFGGVVPELASRSHELKVVSVVEKALHDAKVNKNELSAIAFTRGPGLVGSLLVGVCFAKAMAMALNIPIIEVHHIHAHVLSNFIEKKDLAFPYLSFVVSGGHTQLILVKDYLDMEVLGSTIDDAAGEAFDKAAKMLKLDYPGGPQIDKLAQIGNENAFSFAKPKMEGYNFSFSGVKTSILYFIQKKEKENNNFIQENIFDLAASIQKNIVDILMDKLDKAVKDYSIKQIAIAGGVSANSKFRSSVIEYREKNNVNVHIPSFQYCTDNAGMIAMVGHHKYLKGLFTSLEVEPMVRAYNI
ncbi:MAG: tRNA (adenosine(37)-N6)-threonylcarbamoyltransferase complex transferase subunit TsaD [Chitinophagales bacterium]|nr:tRNA (adenosine(37)-N6)-threonylcarbamoyltransferase complex transferase subunit TsaD [Chitinophagales bacterium]